MKTVEEELRALEAGEIALCNFPHLEHVRMGFEMLARYSFAEAALRFRNALLRLTSQAGKPEAYHETMTMAFLALIGERRALSRSNEWSEFIAANSDLADKKILERWYDADELKSELARTTFLLPRAKRSD